jgi:hypothetical protein
VVTVVVQALAGCRPLDEGTVLCLSDGRVIGRIEEVFGPVLGPLYLLRIGGMVRLHGGSDGGKCTSLGLGGLASQPGPGGPLPSTSTSGSISATSSSSIPAGSALSLQERRNVTRCFVLNNDPNSWVIKTHLQR